MPTARTKQPTIQQLRLPFTYGREAEIEKVPTEIQDFLFWRNKFETEAEKYSHKATDNELNTKVSLRAKSYHTQNARYAIDRMYTPIWTWLSQSAGYTSNRVASHQTIYSPIVLRGKYDEDKKLVVLDLGLAVSSVSGERSDLRKGERPTSRMWFHTELVYQKHSNRHIIDFTESWVAWCHDQHNPGIFLKHYNEIDDPGDKPALVMPWLILNQLTNQEPKYVREARSWVYHTLETNLEVFGASAAVRKELLKKWSTGGVYNNVHIDALSRMLTCHTPRDLIALLVPRNARGAVGSKKVIKHAAESMERILNLSELDITNSHQGFAGILTKYQETYGVIIGIIELYDDPNFIDLIGEIGLPQPPKNGWSSAYQFATPFLKAIKALKSEAYFSEFETTKQWRMIADALMSDNINLQFTRDMTNMMAKITAKKIDLAEKIGRRDIKNLNDLHEEVTKVYNTIKYAPIPISPDYTNWLTNYGLDIDDSKLEFVIPQDTADIRAWGQTQHHCIATYADRMVNGTYVIIGIKDTKTGSWFAHIQMDPVPFDYKAYKSSKSYPLKSGYGEVVHDETQIRVRQFYAAYNRRPPEPGRTKVLNHLKAALKVHLQKPIETEIDGKRQKAAV